MKTFTILAVTGGLFFASVCLDSKHVKHNRVYARVNTRHCSKKCCNNAKKAKAVCAYIAPKTAGTNS